MTEQTTNANDFQFAIQRVYIRDLSFESPKAPAVFLKEWRQAINVELNTRNNSLGEDLHEVVLTLSITAKIDEEVVFIAEIQQAGIFLVKGFDAETLGHMLGAFCPNLLFPYAREALDSLVVKGSFPALMLAPVNFDALYTQELERMQNTTKQ